MNLRESVGNRIRELREERQLSRAQICLTGECLTERQLMRIELGQSLPSLEKLDYIARQLGVSMSQIIEDDSLTLPEEYYQLKLELERQPAYGDKERIKVKQAIIDQIYQDYFDILPEEELLSLELYEYALEERESQSFSELSTIYADYFEQVKLKKRYSANDMLLLGHHIMYHAINGTFDQIDGKFKRMALKQEVTLAESYNLNLLSLLSAFAVVECLTEDARELKKTVDKMNAVIATTQLQYSKALTLCFEAHYRVLIGELEAGESLYDQAILLAGIYGDDVLERNIREKKAEYFSER